MTVTTTETNEPCQDTTYTIGHKEVLCISRDGKVSANGKALSDEEAFAVYEHWAAVLTPNKPRLSPAERSEFFACLEARRKI